ncbi:hypothetical protein TNCV_2650061 [Trichonephila clavipes]|nr:hypothetical protein TNCV_2650061 [Trichonephila clavipes]
MWDALGRQVAGRNYPPTNKNTLIRALTEEWDKLPQQLLDNVVQSMEKSLHSASKRAFRTNGKARRRWSHGGGGGGCMASNDVGKIRQHNVSSKDMLRSVLKEQWEKKSAEKTPRFVISMPKRLQEVHK